MSTLPALLARQARRLPESEALRVGDALYSFGALAERADRAAAALAGRGVGPGDRVVIALPNGVAFVDAFHGALRLGAAAVPVHPGADAERLLQLAALADARHLVVPEPSDALRDAAQAAGVAVVPAAFDGPTGALPEGPSPDDLALVQFTSGSTADPRGVRITHRQLLTNVGQMVEGMGLTAADVFVSWLPVHHDMGLILMTLAPLAVGARLVLLPASLRSVGPWLRAIAEHGGTFTAAPDTAYALCARAVRDPSAHDLSSLRVALDAAEPVRERTIRAFEAAFGLDAVVVAGYGLAEATVGVSMAPPGTPPKVDAARRVSVGKPFPGVEVAILGPDGAPLPAGAVGEIAVAGPAVTDGYLGNPAATAALRGPGGSIRTGDLGYRDADGDLFVVGRAKNVVTQAGRTLYPEDVEGAVATVPGVRRAAAVGVAWGGAECLAVFVEATAHREPEAGAWAGLAADVVDRVHGRFGLRPGRVAVLRPRALPATPNGKLRHAELRRLHESGALRRSGLVLFPDA